MKAAVHTGTFDLQVVETETPPVREYDDVLVKVATVGICGSDKHDFETPPRRRQIPGHEFAGVVAAVGSEPAGFAVGNRVFVNPKTRCGVCTECRSKPRGRCIRPSVYGCRGDQPPGAMAQYCLVRTENLVRVPDDVPLVQAAFVDPVAVAVDAMKSGPDVAGQDCAILGAGVIGLLLAQILKLHGARRVALVDIRPSHLETGRELGDFETYLSDDVDRVSRDLEKLDSAIYFELAGGEAPTLDIAIRAIRKGGTILLVSQKPKGAWINYQFVLFKHLTLRGVGMASEDPWGEATRLVFERKIRVDPIISHHFSLDDVNEAVRTAVEEDSLKVMIHPNPDVA